MAALRISTGAVSADLLATEDIRLVEVPSLVNLAVSSVTNGDTVGLRLNKTVILDTGECNTIAGDVVDPYMDVLVRNSVVGPGQLRIPVGAVTTELQGLINVEPILPGVQAGF